MLQLLLLALLLNLRMNLQDQLTQGQQAPEKIKVDFLKMFICQSFIWPCRWHWWWPRCRSCTGWTSYPGWWRPGWAHYRGWGTASWPRSSAGSQTCYQTRTRCWQLSRWSWCTRSLRPWTRDPSSSPSSSGELLDLPYHVPIDCKSSYIFLWLTLLLPYLLTLFLWSVLLTSVIILSL